MSYYEKRYLRGGVPMPIQCIKIKQEKTRATKLHYHDYTELLFGLSGCAITYIGTERYELCAGDLIIVHNYEPHDVKGNGKKCEYICIKFLPSILMTGDQTLTEYSYGLLLLQNAHSGKIFFHSDEMSDTPIAALFDNLVNEWYGEKFGYELSLRADVTSIFLHIIRKWQEQNPELADIAKSTVQSELLQKAITYINENFADMSEESCADALHVSTSYLSRVFKRGMRTSFCEYVNSVKLKEAERLLVSSDMSVTEISETIGFSSVSYFISAFRSRHGYTPAKYRKVFRTTGDKAE